MAIRNEAIEAALAAWHADQAAQRAAFEEECARGARVVAENNARWLRFVAEEARLAVAGGAL